MLNKIKRKDILSILTIGLFPLIFSFWIMFSTFSYRDSYMLIASKTWSDFAGTIPLIRSFSLGNNLPPQYPLFSGEPIRYHFLFYLIVGMFEKIGLRIDLALNILSAVSFFLLLFAIYKLARLLFEKKSVAILSVIFFLFNGSFSFLEFFKTRPLSLNTVTDIIHNSVFPSFGPYDGKIVSAFWNLNIYTNQRHLAFSFLFLFFPLLLLIKKIKEEKTFSKYQIFIIGILLGILPFINSAVFLMFCVVFGILLLLFPKQRKSLFVILLIGGLISLPRIIFLKETGYSLHFEFGYLSKGDSLGFLNYWFMNFGLSSFLITLGFIFASKFQRKIFVSFFALFLLGNLVQFSPEISANHKFFNAFIIVGNMFSAFSMVILWKNKFFKITVPIILFFMIFSGIIDFFPIKNDRLIPILDYPKNQDVRWIIEHTPKNSIFLNSTYIYHTASLAGRKIFLGWPYFSWSLGYDTNGRDVLVRKMFNPTDINTECILLKKNNISYISLDRENDFVPDTTFFERNFKQVYTNSVSGFTIFDVNQTCSFFK